MSSRLMQILFSFDARNESLGIADLVRITGMSRTTVRRLVLELVEAGAVDRREDGRFTVGLKLWQLATLAPHTESLRKVAHPFVEDLYSALHQHVQLAVLEGEEAVLVDRTSAPRAVELGTRVGGRLPLHCSGVGKVLLAHAGPELLETIVSSPLKAYSTSTITDPTVLRREIAACRQTGTSIVRGELAVDADSVGTRILDRRGRVIASLAVVVRAGSVSLDAALPSVVATGLGISRALGWRPGVPVRDGIA
ncbi:IclR family transcriptional regulator [Microbacterium sp. NPDC096154]|uniref:IclR family transcriptional regulator n=1 Tax=Microbacterium sp. NPDC096154 TaxID=3155549 RepID=UPI003317FFFA